MKPTQAQIEADNYLILRLRQWRSHPFPANCFRDIFETMDNAANRIAALTAAAEAEERELLAELEQVPVRTADTVMPIIKQQIVATIERCAQVAENWKHGASTESKGIADAIRALKEESNVR